jgi:hypothetical protein
MVRPVGTGTENGSDSHLSLTTPPLECLGATMEVVRNLIEKDEEALDLLTHVTRGQQGERTDLVDNVNEVSHRPDGNSRASALRRLRKDRPDLHARVLAGESLTAPSIASQQSSPVFAAAGG